MRNLIAGALLIGALTVNAGASILVSGDVNIGNGIDGSFGAPIGDNGRFFSNVLGSGTKVVLQEGFSAGSAALAYGSIVGLYAGLGVTVDVTTAPITAGDLAGAELVISAIPLTAYTPGEIALLSGFLSSGNTVFFLGENSGFAEGVAGNGFINAALASLGSGLAIVNTEVDDGFHTATGAQIAANPLTAGVNSFSYAAVSTVSGGTPLLLTVAGSPFIAVEAAASNTVPEPSTAAFVFTAVAGLLVFRRLRPRESRP